MLGKWPEKSPQLRQILWFKLSNLFVSLILNGAAFENVVGRATEVVLKRLRRVSVELENMPQVTHLKRRLQIITPSLCEVGEGTGVA